MKTFTLKLSAWRENALKEAQPFMDCYILDDIYGCAYKDKRPAVLVLPGSGYSMCCPREGESVAMEFARLGFQTFVLYYRCKTVYPAPLYDAAEAMTLIRDNAENWELDPNKVAILGFSAGGHLAALLSCLWNDPIIVQGGFAPQKARPNGLILGYPVITGEKGKCHEGSFEWLLGDKLNEMRGEMSLETRVTKNNPPTFIWSTAEDNAVPVISSFRFAAALAQAGVSVETHIFPRGGHGSALCRMQTCGNNPEHEIPENAIWIDLCGGWIKRLFGTGLE